MIRWIVLVFLAAAGGSAGCSDSGGGEPLWRDACKHSMSLEDPNWRASEDAQKRIIGGCLRSMQTIPNDEADRMSRCVLGKKNIADIESWASGGLVGRVSRAFVAFFGRRRSLYESGTEGFGTRFSLNIDSWLTTLGRGSLG